MSDSNLSRALAEVERVNAGAGDDALTLGVLTPLTGPGDPVAGELIVRGACVVNERDAHERLLTQTQ